jgi:uncharacterized damage-inducible protein DinB
MNEALLDAFRHNAWATQQLLEYCRDLPDEHLRAPANGAYGGILETFDHIVRSDAGYLGRLTKDVPDWVRGEEEGSMDLDAARDRTKETLPKWERFASQPFDAEEIVLLDNGTYETHLGVILAQALHHGNVHREQICATITGLGMQPPDVQAWTYAEATGQARELPGSGSS